MFFDAQRQKQIHPNPPFTKEGVKAPPFAKGHFVLRSSASHGWDLLLILKIILIPSSV